MLLSNPRLSLSQSTRIHIGNPSFSITIQTVTYIYILSSATHSNESARETALRQRFQKRLSAGDPIARQIENFRGLLNGRSSVHVEMTLITDTILMDLMDDEWVETDVMSASLKLLIRDRPEFELIISWTLQWNLSNMSQPPSEHITDINTKTILVPTNVSKSQWMLCVCSLQPQNLGSGTITFYNSLASEYWDIKCYQVANNVARVLRYFGINFYSRLSGIEWTATQGLSG